MPRRQLTFAPLSILILAALATLTSTASTAPPWETKDWTQWTDADCQLILAASPWVSTNSSNGPNSYEKGGQVKSVAQIVSSLVIRRAAVREAQLQMDHDHMQPDAKKVFDQQADACLNQNVSDRIVIGLDADAQIDDSKISGEVGISKRTYPITPVSDWNTSNPCPFYPVVISFPRVTGGNPAIGPGDKKLEIKSPSLKHFSFDLQKMIYKGKPDF